jgi:hypothetical protein
VQAIMHAGIDCVLTSMTVCAARASALPAAAAAAAKSPADICRGRRCGVGRLMAPDVLAAGSGLAKVPATLPGGPLLLNCCCCWLSAVSVTPLPLLLPTAASLRAPPLLADLLLVGLLLVGLLLLGAALFLTPPLFWRPPLAAGRCARSAVALLLPAEAVRTAGAGGETAVRAEGSAGAGALDGGRGFVCVSLTVHTFLLLGRVSLCAAQLATC